MDIDKKKIVEALARLDGTILMGADGFIDEVWEPVSSRASLSEYTLYSHMKQFGQRILDCGTGGMGVELIKKRRAFGGFTANIGYAAARLGVKTTMFGVYGAERIDPIFQPVADISRIISTGDAAITHVLEFNDGKILMSHMDAVLNVSWRNIADVVGIENIISYLTESDIIGVGYWSLLPAFDEIVAHIGDLLPNDGKPRRFFFDFADFSKRDADSLRVTLNSLKILNKKIPMTLSVNEHEAASLFSMYGETFDENGIQEKSETIREKLGLDELVIHTPRFAAIASLSEGSAVMPQEFCEKPIRSAGAGDTFNGGYIAARLAGLDIRERLYTAGRTVFYFLNSGQAPNREELVL